MITEKVNKKKEWGGTSALKRKKGVICNNYILKKKKLNWWYVTLITFTFFKSIHSNKTIYTLRYKWFRKTWENFILTILNIFYYALIQYLKYMVYPCSGIA